MTLDEGTKFFEDNCYYEHKPAYQEALRGTFDPEYLYYTVGKLDWMAAGLPTEGTNAGLPRAGNLARKDTPTCSLDEQLGAVRDRVHALGWDAVVVVNVERIVFGLLRAKELAFDCDRPIAQAMRPGPSTFRPYSCHALIH